MSDLTGFGLVDLAGVEPVSTLAPARALALRTPKERTARGREARTTAPRSSHGRWQPDEDRDPIALLEQQAETRVPDLVPIRHGRMLESPFAFYRGAALIMASDLAGTPRSGLTVQLCGDAHLSNFGVFASPERRMLFDINDFDETLPGPWEWDVKRLAASFEVAGRELGFARADRRAVVVAGVQEYRERMRIAAQMRALDAWYEHMDIAQLSEWINAEVRAKRLGRKEAKEAADDIEKARTRDHKRGLLAAHRRRDALRAGSPADRPDRGHRAPGIEREVIEGMMRRLITGYQASLVHAHHPVEEYRYVHLARKVVGVGSVGTRAWVVLMLGRDDNDPLILQAKEAEASVVERFLGRSQYDNHGQRVVMGQRLMQSASDIFLGWHRVTDMDGRDRDYYVRQLHDWKGGVEVETMRVPGATLYARVCGATLARAHARSGSRIAIASYLGRSDTFDRAVADFSAAYADQNERDYKTFAAAIRSGRLAAALGV